MNNNNYTGFEIAIIGMAGKFPGAKNLDEYWENLKNGKECISYFTNDELRSEGIKSDVLNARNYVPAKGIIEGIENFDSDFFEFSPQDAFNLDPQIRIFHEVCYEALENAGYSPDKIKGRTGVYAGAAMNILAMQRILAETTFTEQFQQLLLNDTNYLTTLISYKLNLQGPSLTVQTACSSSLVSVHLACQSILSGECELAIAGGVNVLLPHKAGYLSEEGMITSPDGHCRPFDANANGTVFSDGAGAVILKSLDKAILDKDNILAIIKGSAINNDGSEKIGFTAPGPKGQEKVLKYAYSSADVLPESISYIEAHGTGTNLGDPIEIEALSRVFSNSKIGSCQIGSVKSNIGHTYSAAGIASLIKTVLALKNGLIPPTINFNEPNSKINFETGPFKVSTKLGDWPQLEFPRRAGVSSFGVGGTNAHVVLEEAPKLLEKTTQNTFNIVSFSAKVPNSLEKSLSNFLTFVEGNSAVNLDELAYTLHVGRSEFEYRKSYVTSSLSDLAQQLKLDSSILKYPEKYKSVKNDIVFMFTGQGSQYINMTYGLFQENAIFKAYLESCFSIVKSVANIDLESVLFNKSVDSKSQEAINQTSITQLALFSVEYSMAKLFIDWGIKPTVMIGHSIGEYVAACVSGLFSLQDAIFIVANRGSLMQECAPGAMISVPKSLDQINYLISDDISIAAINTKNSCVLSGTFNDIDKLIELLNRNNIQSRRLQTSHAFHSSMMEPILEKFKAKFANIKFGNITIPFVSNLSGNWATEAEVANPDYWAQHLRGTVKFAEGLNTIMSHDEYVYVELGPGQTLSTFVLQEKLNKKCRASVPTIKNPKEELNDIEYLYKSLSKLWELGVSVNWNLFYAKKKQNRIQLPTYAFQKSAYPCKLQNVEIANISTSTQAGQTEIKQEDKIEAHFDFDFEIKNIWREILGISSIKSDDNFFALGGDSLKAVTAASKIRKKTGIQMQASDFFKFQTVDDISNYLTASQGNKIVTSIPRRKNTSSGILSSGQGRLWFVNSLNPGTPALNIPGAIKIGAEINQDTLRVALNMVVNNHESLRSIFINNSSGNIEIRVIDRLELELPLINIERSQNINEVLNLAAKESFDLEKGPLIRFKLFKLEKEEYILFVCAHHIISDNTSIGCFIQESFDVYFELSKGNKTPVKSNDVHFSDYAEWQLNMSNDLLSSQLTYWKNKLANVNEAIKLPIDFSRPNKLSSKSGHIKFTFEKSTYEKMLALSRSMHTSLFVITLASFKILLSKLTNSSDIVIGSPIANRSLAELQNMIGFLANTVVLRSNVDDTISFQEYIKTVQETCFEAFENSNLPFSKVVEAVSPKRNQSYNPLFQVMFGMVMLPKIQANDSFPVEVVDIDSGYSDYDLNVRLEEGDQFLQAIFDYSADLFTHETAKAISESFESIINQIVNAPELVISDIVMPQTIDRLVKDYHKKNKSLNLNIASSFTDSVIKDSLEFWAKKSSKPLTICFSDYNQIFNQLLNTEELFHTNNYGYNVILIRVFDWVRYKSQANIIDLKDELSNALIDFISMTKSFVDKSKVDLITVICPFNHENSEYIEIETEFNDLLVHELGKLKKLHLLDYRDFNQRYDVGQIFDSVSDKQGHIPFTLEYYALLGSELFRKINSINKKVYKVIVTDCDNTLWNGILGEDGINGITISNAQKRYQEFLVEKQKQGYLLACCSKNEEVDVKEALTSRTDFQINVEHFVAFKVNWEPKSKNIKELANELNLGLDSFIFIDDNPIECEEVKSNCPEVYVINFPKEEKGIFDIVNHAWVFDKAKVTKEDAERTIMYKTDIARQSELQNHSTLQDFLNSLKLEVDIHSVEDDEIDRASQLTMRTNQFNTTTIRKEEADIKRNMVSNNQNCYAVNVKDRFGDYGMVGLFIFDISEKSIDVSSLMLSCRVLGKGVEHVIVSYLGSLAKNKNKDSVRIQFISSDRNYPVMRFLDNIDTAEKQYIESSVFYTIKAEEALKMKFNIVETNKNTDVSETEHVPKVVTVKSDEKFDLEFIQLCSNIDSLYKSIQSQKQVSDDIKINEYIAPENELEKSIVAIYQELLGVERVGVNDNFFDLGGHSLLLVQLASKLEKETKRPISAIELFKYPSIKLLANFLGGGLQSNNLAKSKSRGERQRMILQNLNN